MTNPTDQAKQMPLHELAEIVAYGNKTPGVHDKILVERCKELYMEIEAHERNDKAATDIIDDMSKRIAEGWISVEDELPEEDQTCWYYFEVTGVSFGKYLGNNCFGGHRGFLCGDVTHWRPQAVPAPPKGE